MAIPDYQTIMLPLLKLVKQHGDITLSKATAIIADQFNLTELERRQVLSSGKQAVINSRVSWANTYLKKAGLLFSPQRGILSLTERGETVLSQKPESINVEYLRQFPDFVAFKNAIHQKLQPAHTDNINLETPEEILEEAYLQIKEQALSDVLDKIKSCSPLFFENLVVDTIVKMGYGGSHKDAGQAIGRSGDEGIDGRTGLGLMLFTYKQNAGLGMSVGQKSKNLLAHFKVNEQKRAFLLPPLTLLLRLVNMRKILMLKSFLYPASN